VHVVIGMSWYLGATPDELVALYKRHYPNVRCVLYKSFSPIARFQHLIASPFN